MAREDKLVERITYLTKIALGEDTIEIDGAILQAAIKAAKVGYSYAVDEACEWLRVELDKEEERHYIHVHGFDKERREIFLEDFRKAMKGGEK